MNKHILIATLISLIGIIIFSYGLTISFTEHGGYLGELSLEDTECYDRYGNEIKDLVCEEEIIDYDIALLLSLVFGTIIIAIGFAYLFGSIIRNDALLGQSDGGSK